MKTRDTQWFNEQYKELALQGESWGTAEMYHKKMDCLRWCCAEQATPDTASILDLGCGAGELAALLAEAGFSRVDGIDISAVAIERAKTVASGRFFVMDFAAPCRLEREYDCIFDTDCFQMVVESRKRCVFLANVAASLAKDGLFLTGVNSTKQGIDPCIVVGEHIQYFWPTTEKYVEEVCEAGFLLAARRDLPPRNKEKCDRWSELVFKPTGKQSVQRASCPGALPRAIE